jgi:hypothetical protein
MSSAATRRAILDNEATIFEMPPCSPTVRLYTFNRRGAVRVCLIHHSTHSDLLGKSFPADTLRDLPEKRLYLL